MNSRPLLIIDDNHADYIAITRSLENIGFNNIIFRCEDGNEAMDFIQKKGKFKEQQDYSVPALILLDLNLPGLGGLEFLKEVRKNKLFKNVPIVILSTSANENDIAQSYLNGATSYLQKPISFHTFFEMVRLLIEYWYKNNIPPKSDILPL